MHFLTERPLIMKESSKENIFTKSLTKSMSRNFLKECIIIFAISLLAFPITSTYSYYGRYAMETKLTFKGEVEFYSKKRVTYKSVRSNKKLKKHIQKTIKNQVDHLMGYLQSNYALNLIGSKGSPSEQYTTKTLSVKKSRSKNHWVLTYAFDGKAAFEKKIFGSKKSIQISLRLPKNPKTIYKISKKGSISLCTDEEYDSKEDFFYFWDLSRKGCSLKKDFKNVPLIKATLEPLKNTRWSYPEYDKIYGDNGNGQDLIIYTFFGYMDPLKNADTPNRRDESYKAYQKVKKALLKRDMKVEEQEGAFRIFPEDIPYSKHFGEKENFVIYDGANYISTLTKKIRFRGESINLRIKLLLSDTDINSDDDTFRYFYEKALRTADIIEYEGHSGLGANLSLKKLEITKLNKKKYQLYFFNACSTYKYFNNEYLKAKGGPKNLDIILSGLPTYGDSALNNSLAFLDTFIEAKSLTFQTIVSRIEDSSDGGPYLYSVVGDHDNTWKP